MSSDADIVKAKNAGRCAYLGIIAGSAAGPVGAIVGGVVGGVVGHVVTAAFFDATGVPHGNSQTSEKK